MDSFEGSSWDFLDYDLVDGGNTSSDFSWLNPSVGLEPIFTPDCVVSQENESVVKECPRKRGRSDSCCRSGTKADRERLRRERMNDRFIELSSVLDPGRPAKTDKVAILADAIRVLNQLRTEAQDLKESNEKLQEEIKNLKAEKSELREEKCGLKADKDRLEQQMKGMGSAGFLPAQPAGYHPVANKMAVFPSYGVYPMWQYLPPASVDTSRDHELWPPAA